jgi:hypothetical protein
VKTPGTAKLTGHRAHICAALKIADSDLGAALATGTPTDDLSLDNLSTLFVRTTVAHLAGWTLAEYQELRSIGFVDKDPITPQDVESLLDDAELLRRLGVGATDLSSWRDGRTPPPEVLDALADTQNTGRDPSKWGGIISAWLNLDPRVGDAFEGLGPIGAKLAAWCSKTPAQPPQAEVITCVRALSRLALPFQRFGVQPDDAKELLALPAIGDLTATYLVGAPANTQWAAVRSTYAWLDLARSLPGRSLARLTLFGRESSQPGLTPAETAAIYATAYDADAKTVEAVWSATGTPTPSDLRSVTWIQRCRAQARLVRGLGVSASTLAGWATNTANSAQAATVRSAVHATLTDDQWSSLSTKVQNELRNDRCAALVDFLIASGGPNAPRTANELSRFFLIDVKDDACNDTSRVAEAHTAIQSFVRYCFDGQITHGAILDEEARQQWHWRGDYRLWQANRSIYLYPENFLRSGSRSSASLQCMEAQATIRQGKLTEEAVAAGLERYLTGVEDIANLEYLAVSGDLQVKADLLARTRQAPRTHFFRSVVGGRWTPWEKIPTPISSNHIAMTRDGKKVYLAWPSWTEQGSSNQEVRDPTQSNGGLTPQGPIAAQQYVLLSYDWMVRDRHGWGEARTGDRCCVLDKAWCAPRDRLVTSLETVPGDEAPLRIRAYLNGIQATSGDEAGAGEVGVFHVARGITRIVVETSDYGEELSAPSWCPPELLPHQNKLEFTFPARVLRDQRTSLRSEDNRFYGKGTLNLYGQFGAWKPYDTLAFGSLYTVAVSREPQRDWRYSAAVTDSERSFLLQTDEQWYEYAEDGWFATFVPGHHPFATDLRVLVERASIDAIFRPHVQERPSAALRGSFGERDYFTSYACVPASKGGAWSFGAQIRTGFIGEEFSGEQIDFNEDNPYAIYNWELFFHLPVWVADSLRAARQFEQAERFYHFIFNPTPITDENAVAPDDPARFWVTKPLRELARSGHLKDQVRKVLETSAGSRTNPYEVIEQSPFDAHEVARTRHPSYARYVVMRYLDNLITWADSLIAAGGKPNFEKARSLYMKAEDLLGPKPVNFKRTSPRKLLSFADREADWAGSGNLLVEIENLIPPMTTEIEDAHDTSTVDLPLISSDGALYFCIPPNDVLLSYWDRVATALAKMRECKFPMPLFDPKIDPQALADAVASGRALEDILDPNAAALEEYRFGAVVQKAHATVADLKSLGSQLKEALEKRDEKALANLRLTHEGVILQQTTATRTKQIEQANAELDVLAGAKATVTQRKTHYAALSKEFMNDLEETTLGLHIGAIVLDAAGLIVDLASGGVQAIPDFEIGAAGIGGSPLVTIKTGGTQGSSILSKIAQGLTRGAGLVDRAANMVSTQAGYERRKEDWDFQVEQADAELQHLEKQVTAATLRVKLADLELALHQQSVNHNTAMDAATRARFTNEQLYEWHAEQLVDLYGQSFRLARKACERVARCFEFEKDAPPVESLAPTWNTLHQGFTAGEGLACWLHGIEQDYLDRRPKENEFPLVRRDFLLSEIAPLALKNLRTTGKSGPIPLAYWWFYRADPGLMNRRLRTFAVSLPCVHGPTRAVNATVRLTAPVAQPTTRSSIVLSSGVSDTGWDPAQLADRYGPFERLSLDGDTTWTIEFPDETGVDTKTISDAVLQFEFSAVPGPKAGGPPNPPSHMAIFDVKRMFPSEWASFAASAGTETLVIDVQGYLSELLASMKLDFTFQGAGIYGVGGQPLADLGAPSATGTRVTMKWSGLQWAEPPLVILVAGVKP